jgi:F-type H+-transporting ATPase subunit b
MGLLEQLNIDPRAILVNIVGFLLLLFVLRRMVFTPIGKVLAERQQDVNSAYEQLESDRRRMEAMRTDYEQRLASIEAEAREKIQGAIKDAQAARDQIVGEAQERSREMIQRAEAEAVREREQAMITLRQQVVDLALGATSRVIGEGLDETRQRRLIDDFISSGVAASAANGASASPLAGGAAVFATAPSSPNGGAGSGGPFATDR